MGRCNKRKRRLISSTTLDIFYYYKKNITTYILNDIYNVYDYNFINLLCKNMVLLYNDIDDSEIENIDNPEEEQETYRVKSSINCFYEILSSGNLKKFDSLVNILMGTNDDKKDKIKLMIDIAPNFKNYISLIDDIIKNGKLNYREKYALIELLKKM